MRRIGIAILALAGIAACGKPFFKAGPKPDEPPFPVPASAALVQEISVSYEPCLGTCPAYSFHLSRGGASTYIGEYYTPILGTYTGVVDSATFAALAKHLIDVHFFEWPRVIGPTGFDAGGASVGARTDRGTYSVSMQVTTGTPGEAELRALLNTIEEAAGSIAWTNTQHR